MDQIFGFLGPIIILGSIIAIHEFGHYIVARWSGMGIHEFSIGFGPAIFKRESKGTLYALRLIPLGGYVRIAGMEPGEEQGSNGFYTKPFFQKFATIAAGALMNFVLATIIFIVMGMAFGYLTPTNKPIIASVVADLPAAKAGIKANDRIISINNKPVKTWEDVTTSIHKQTKEVTLIVKRNNENMTFAVTPKAQTDYAVDGLRIKKKTIHVIGIAGQVKTVNPGILQSISNGFSEIYHKMHLMLASFVTMLAGDVQIKDIGGPIQIIRISHEASKGALNSQENMQNFLGLLAFLSVNIGFINLLPIPALDGGHLFFLLAEKVSRRKFNLEKLAWINAAGMILLLSLILAISIKDVFQLFGGGK